MAEGGGYGSSCTCALPTPGWGGAVRVPHLPPPTLPATADPRRADLEVGELREGLFAARVRALVGSVAGVDSGGGGHTSGHRPLSPPLHQVPAPEPPARDQHCPHTTWRGVTPGMGTAAATATSVPPSGAWGAGGADVGLGAKRFGDDEGVGDHDHDGVDEDSGADERGGEDEGSQDGKCGGDR